jgi:hypothetical protein
MNNKKRPSDLSPETFKKYRANGKLPRTSLFRDTVRDLREFPLSNEARLTWVYLQPFLGNRERWGYLVNGDDPIPIKWLAFIWRREEDDLGAEIEDLVKCQLLGKDGDFIFDPMMIQCGRKDTSVPPSDPKEITLEDIEKIKRAEKYKNLCVEEELIEWRKSCKARRVMATLAGAKSWLSEASKGLAVER